jgi:hypothetical protein
MALNPQQVTTDVTVTWDGVSQRIPRGTIIDVPPLSVAFAGLLALQSGFCPDPLMTAIGAGNLTPLTAGRFS